MARTTITKTEITCDACGVNLTAGGGDAPMVFRVGRIDLCGACAGNVVAQKKYDNNHQLMFEAMGEDPRNSPDKDSWGKN